MQSKFVSICTPYPVWSQRHNERADGDEHAAQQRFERELFPQEKRGQKKCEDEAEFVDGDDLCHLPHLQRLIIAQPACPCGKAGEHEEHKASAADVLHAGLRPGDEHHAPGHHKHEDGVLLLTD